MPSKNMHVVILAGGKGTRLKPYTTFVPKPLMPIGDLPIIELILRQLKKHGLEQVTLAVGHMAQLVQAFVGDGSKFGLKIDYSLEEKPLGTAGPLGMLRDRLSQVDGIMTINGDTLTTLDYSKAIDAHFNNKAAATICLNRRNVNVDFGVIETGSKGELVEYLEKPQLNYKVSMGVNLFSPKVLDLIPREQPFTLPELMLAVKNNGDLVYCYDDDCYWLDIGRIEDYSEACETFEKNRGDFLKDEPLKSP